MKGRVGAPPRNRAAPGSLPVALVTDDFRLYHRLAPFLEAYGIRVLGLAPHDEVPAAARVVLAGPPGDPRSIPVRDDLEATLLATFAALDPRGRGQGYTRVVFGVDPGQVIGLAVLADGEPLLVGEARDVQQAAARLAAWATGLTARVWDVHVGDGAPETGKRLVRAVRTALPDAHVAVVGEEGTSPWFAVTGSRHTDAAIQIARREPGPRLPPGRARRA